MCDVVRIRVVNFTDISGKRTRFRVAGGNCMKARDYPWPEHSREPRRIDCLTRLCHHNLGQRHTWKSTLQLASDLARAVLHVTIHRLQSLLRGDAGRDNPIAKLARYSERARSVGCNIKRDRVIEIDEASVAMKVTDFAAQPVG